IPAPFVRGSRVVMMGVGRPVWGDVATASADHDHLSASRRFGLRGCGRKRQACQRDNRQHRAEKGGSCQRMDHVPVSIARHGRKNQVRQSSISPLALSYSIYQSAVSDVMTACQRTIHGSSYLPLIARRNIDIILLRSKIRLAETLQG